MMKPTKLPVVILTLVILMAMVSQSFADISNAAVLYLRIAPGARAAAMGEAYVAIADDATSTHWNPAGLGAYPLSPGWVQASVPEHMRPVTDVAAQKTRGGGTYAAYDVWALTPAGLARFDNKRWYLHEVFDTKTDQTVRGIVASYFGLTDSKVIQQVANKVAAANNEDDYVFLDSLATAVKAAAPSNYPSLKSLEFTLDSLLAAYELCHVNWDKVYEISERLEEGLKDGAMTETEMDRVYFAAERSRTRFIPEQLKIEYSALIRDSVIEIESSGENLLVATTGAVYTYDGKRWQVITSQNGLPSSTVTALKGSEMGVFIGTDSGIVKYAKGELSAVGNAGDLPPGRIDAIATESYKGIWAVVDKEIYHLDMDRLDRRFWTNYRTYKVVIDDTLERIAEKLAIYGTTAEKEAIIEAIRKLNRLDSDMTVASTSEEDSASAGPSTEAESVVTENEGSAASSGLEPGGEIRVPYSSKFKGEVTALHAGRDGKLWVGTSYGVILFDGERWSLPGYTEQVYESVDIIGESAARVPLDKEAYLATVMDINDLESREVEPGRKVKLYLNPTAAPVKEISSRRGRTYFATSLGLVEYDGVSWSKVFVHGMDKAGVTDVESVDDEIWFAADKKIVCKANSKTDISMMYVKWLPELADDLYYAFASFATHKEGWGTFGGNFTYISYGTIPRTGDEGQDLGTFESFDFALTGSWGTPITDKLKAGLSAKLLVSKLAEQGAGEEQGEGSSTGFAIDVGLIYHLTKRLNLGLAITNLGPDMAYIDAAQSDPLPRNLALGFAYRVLQSDYYHFLVTAEVNKSLVGVDDGFREELKQLVLNSGGEFLYSNILALRAGYVYDQEGDIKTATLGVGIGPVGIFRFDFSYIPSNSGVVLENTLRISFAIQP